MPILRHPAAAEEIKKKHLHDVIRQYFSENDLKVVSSRATWLGNDETHYERRWVGKDLTDLKKLISAVVHFISMNLLVAELPTDMPDSKQGAKAAGEFDARTTSQ